MPDQDPVKVNRAPARRRWRRVEQARSIMERGAKAAAKTVVDKAKAGDLKAARFVLEHVAVPDETGAELRPIAQGVDSRGGNALAPAAPEAPRIMIAVGLGSDFARLANTSPERLNSAPADRPALAPVLVTQAVSSDE